MIRLRRYAGLCGLVLGSLAVAACDDSEDRVKGSDGQAGKSVGGSSSGGKAGQSQGGSEQGGSNLTAGTGFGEAGNGGTGAVSGGGAGGSGGAPTCATSCNDNNPCTDDACENDVCVHRDNTAACSDGNACTSDDACSAGICRGTNNTATCDDENECTSDDACNNGVCQGTNNAATCDDGNECTSADVCSNGACQGSNNTADCDDLSTCTTGDQCWNGACLGTQDVNLCPACNVAGNLIQNCDFSQGEEHWPEGFFDGGAGTQEVIGERLIVDITNGAGANYAVQPRQEPLSLKQGMKYRLRLVAGASVPRSFVVSLTLASAPYTIFTPGDTEAGYTVTVTEQMEPYEFEFVVTEPDSDNVKLELKLGGPNTSDTTVYIDDVYLAEVRCAADLDCDDAEDCTTDACNVAAGTCNSTARNGACTDDQESCTVDECVEGKCTHEPLDDDEACASDGDDCTADICVAGACTNVFDTMVCDCQEDVHCDDNEPCTDDVCNNGTCSNENNTAACDDANACTSDDVCAAGVCGGTDNTNACTDADPCTVDNMCSAGTCGAGTNVCFDCTAGGNLLTNCSFDSDATGWLAGFFEGGAGSQAVESGMLAVHITSGGGAVWQVQPRQEGLVLAQNTSYVVRFNAYASIARPMIVSLTRNGGDFQSYSGPQTFDLTTKMQELTFEFTMAAPAPAENVKFEIDLGGPEQNPSVPNTVYLDNLFIGPKP